MSILPPYVNHQAFFTLVESFVFVPIISRHKYSACHSRLCSERPLSAYLYKM